MIAPDAASPLLLLTANEVAQVFDMPTAIASQRAAFRALGDRRYQMPARLLLTGPEDSATFCYAARASLDGGAVCKFGSSVPANTARGLPTVAATITVLDPFTGAPAAIMDGTTVTTIRTSAASAVAAEALARPKSGVLAVVGSGVQAAAHIRALGHLFDLREVRVYGRTPAHVDRLIDDVETELPARLHAAASAQNAVEGADLIVAATTSLTPVVEFDWVSPGATVISVGSFAPDRGEVSAEFLHRCDSVVVDDADASLEHAGPVREAVGRGMLIPAQIPSLGEVITERSPGRAGPEDIVFYNSVGVGIQDAAAAEAIVAAARERGIGQAIVW